MLHIFPYRGKCSDVQSCPTLCDPVAWQAPLFMVFARQEYWSGLSYPPSEDRPNPGIKPLSPASPALASRYFPTAPPGKPILNHIIAHNQKCWVR